MYLFIVLTVSVAEFEKLFTSSLNTCSEASCRLGSKPCEMDSRPFLHTFDRAKLGPELPEPLASCSHVSYAPHLQYTYIQTGYLPVCSAFVCRASKSIKEEYVGQVVFVIQILTLSCPLEAEYDLSNFSRLFLKILFR